MKKILHLLIILIICSCTKSEIDEINNDPENFYLNFDINDNVYKPEEQNEFSVKSNQDVNSPLVFVDFRKTHLRYPFYPSHLNNPDSINIVTTVKFEGDINFGFEDKTIQMEINVYEDISNLIQINDSSYVYKSMEILYGQLLSKNFGNPNISKSYDRALVHISVPSQIVNLDFGYYTPYTSNGFHFPHEDIILNSIKINRDRSAIRLNGTFEVELKMMGCGFYSTHHISNAEFNLILNEYEI